MDLTLTSEITVTPIQHVGGDHIVVAAARVSTTGVRLDEQVQAERSGRTAGLIRYLMRSRHGSPFESGSMTFAVHAPRFVAMEHIRHRIGWSYSMESQRYREIEPVFWVPPRERPMLRAEGHKPSRPSFNPLIDDSVYDAMLQASTDVYTAAYTRYRDEVEHGIATEVARRLLPEATYTSYWATCNPRSLMHFLSLRTVDDHARVASYPQAEIVEVARQMEAYFAEWWPITYAAFNEYGRVAP